MGCKNTFFSAINATTDWAPIEKDINRVYKKGRSATGRSSYSELWLFKTLLIQTWYNLNNLIRKKGLDHLLRKVNCLLEKKGLKPKEGAARVDATITQTKRAPKGPKQWEAQLLMLGMKIGNVPSPMHTT